MGRSRSRSAALLGALALSGFLACTAPAEQKEPPAAQPKAQSEPPESRRISRADPAAEDALRNAHDAVGAAEAFQDRNRQRQTIRDLRSLATALVVWHQDAVDKGDGTTHQEMRKPTTDVEDYPLISQEDLERLLIPRYIARLPTVDAWGHPYEVRVKASDVFSDRVFLIRSAGRDGEYSTDSYTIGAFDPNDFDQDIVLADGFFVRWPDGEL